jgi:hypothetical protein
MAALSAHLTTCKIDTQLCDLLFNSMDKEGYVRAACLRGDAHSHHVFSGAMLCFALRAPPHSVRCVWCGMHRRGLLSWEEFLAGFSIMDEGGVAV